ncbi:SDR family oxidoreductase [Crossiella sp. CA-258035]|uniref:type I polyketide synthase n=1 Tax=Crossiella sp. CA-258035 TaxID=2981138 RepID=UPI0024BC789E|nr:type I polyketide synthase [Crossiella sp. CA-258035]WHT16646.1 SDR family oxidoreductase [Crossiella sp. CA-258035]
MRSAAAALLGTPADALPVQVALRELGADSAGLTRLTQELSRRLGRPVPAWAPYRHPTVAALTAFLDGRPTGRPESTTEAVRNEPIAIVGLGCRLPGGIGTPGQLWDALLAEVDAVGPVPADRWHAEQWYDADVTSPGRTTTRRGGFLDDVAGFDAAFFRMSPAEAEHADPQQRITLEVAWSALEDARIVPGGLTGSRTGVFLGTMWQEYYLATGADPNTVGSQSAVGWDTSIIPARVAYALGLQGPAVSVGSACSSSLAAVHLAAHSLRRGESDLALAGGISLMLHPHTTVAMTKFGGVNPDAQCRAFDAGANGYVRSEGCGVVVLRRLSDALRDGNRIYAVLLGSAMNNDGASNGLTAPNPEAQVDVLRSAWREAGVPTDQVSYVEAHGTGTKLGDVIETSALGEVFGPGRAEPLRIGSAKTNFGHLEPAAGVLGLMKTALSLYHGELPASLHFDEPNPNIDFAAEQLQVVTCRSPWPAGHRYAGVSGFGFGGTNVHLALGQAPASPRTLVALGADTAEELWKSIAATARGPVAPVLSSGSGPHRAFAALERPADLVNLLALAEVGVAGTAPALAFCFSGHGSQWTGMGRDLLTEPEFRAAMSEVDSELASVLGRSVLDDLLEERRLERADVVQPALFAVQVALFRTLAARGVTPAVVFGQSVGEVAAAVAAGALTVAQGAQVIGRWSRLIAERAAGTGTVLVCDLDVVEAARRVGDRLTVAGELSPGQVCVSGATEAIDEFEQELTEAGIGTVRVAIDYPSHSRELAALTAELTELLGDIRPAATRIPFLSTVTGGELAGTELDGAYWARNMCEPMRLVDAVRALPPGCRIVEVSPHPVLRVPIGRTLDTEVLATCRRNRPGTETLADLLGLLWTDGVDVDWGGDTGQPVAWPLSAQSPSALRAQAEALRAHAESAPALGVADIGLSLATTRTAFEHRAVVVGHRRDLLDGLAALAAGEDAPGLVVGRAQSGSGPVLVFPGQGSQWVGMALELADSTPVFTEALAKCERALTPYVDWSLTEALGDEEALRRVDVVQPALWAVMVSLAALWSAHGVRPAAVVGHSQGEIAAACAVGALSLEDGARIVALRSQEIARALAGHGGMVSTTLPRTEALARLAEWDGRLSLAAANGPAATVISGDPGALHEFVAKVQADGVRARHLPVDYASHSDHVEAIRGELLTALAPIQPRTAEAAFWSTVTAGPLDTSGLNAEYWYDNLRSPVEFEATVAALIEAGHRTFIEVSPHPVLTAGIQDAGQDVLAFGSLRRDDGGPQRFLTSLGQAHAHGLPVRWDYPGARLVDLPTYRFQHQRYWLETTPPATTTATPESETFWHLVHQADVESLQRLLAVSESATLPELVSALASWHRRENAAKLIEDWRYATAWRAVADPARTATGSWLVLVPKGEGPWTDAVSGLHRQGLRLVTVECEHHPGRDELATASAAAVPADVTGVLSLLALIPGERVDHPGVPAGYAATLLALQALGDARISAPLWCVTSGAMITDPGDREVRPDQRMVWGLGRVAGHEHHDRWGGLIDLPAEPREGSWRQLAAALTRTDGEDQLALRPFGTLACRLVRPAAHRAEAGEWRPKGTVLVTGGTGALGAHVARWLAERGARELVLVSRRGPAAPGAAELHAELAELGAEVRIEACDVSDRGQLRELLARVGDLDAVVHTAAVLADSTLRALSLAQVAEAQRAKVVSAWHLHELTAELNLSAFVLFSTLGATVGIPGQGNYAPANAALDALAELRRAQGLPATAVSFGAWDGDGLATTAVRPTLERHGINLMAPELALKALQEAIDGGRASQVVADIKWERFAPTLTALRPSPLLADLPDARTSSGATATATEPDLADRLAALPARRRAELVLDVVLRHTAAVLGYRRGDRPEETRTFRDLGIDSVTGADLSKRLGAETGVRLPVTLVFEQPTPAAVAEHLLDQLDLDDPATEEAPAAAPMADVSDDELFDLIDSITMSRRNT